MTILLALPDGAPRVTLLDQTCWWWAKTPTGELYPIQLEEMTVEHRRALLAWLRRHAAVMHAHQARTNASLWQSGLIDDTELGRRMRALRSVAPQVWLEDTPLVRRLVQLVPRDPAPPRRRSRRLTALLRRTSTR